MNFIDERYRDECGYICSSYRKKNGTYNIKKDEFNYALRFNLSAGELKYKWMLIDRSPGITDFFTVHFYDPELVSFKIKDAFLYNNHTNANKIFKGGNKTVVSMILSNYIELVDEIGEGEIKVSYNPQKAPFWRLYNKTTRTYSIENIDLTTNSVYTYKSSIYQEKK